MVSLVSARIPSPVAQSGVGDSQSRTSYSKSYSRTVVKSYSPLSAGLVVIGVDPGYQGKGLGSLLLQEFERRALAMHCPICTSRWRRRMPPLSAPTNATAGRSWRPREAQ
ncbi:MAG: GNAT family N-acetyltransferase [Saprospiraceae bacterium]|nr:GNAT family N-acetyltransferase [Saprospiraceae bacterium]